MLLEILSSFGIIPSKGQTYYEQYTGLNEGRESIERSNSGAREAM